MDIEIVAAAAIFLYSTYQYCLSMHRNTVEVIDKKEKCILSAKKRKQKRRWWMKKIHQSRTGQTMNCLLSNLVDRSGDNFVQMSATDFEYILQKISPVIAKKDTYWRQAIPPKIRLAITLRFLATGESYRSMHSLFTISTSLISKVIPEVCLALNQVLKDIIIIPKIPEQWLANSKKFSFPHCLGTMEGKHITITPNHAGPEYLNYKGSYSIILWALIDSDYCFMYADIDTGITTESDNSNILNQDALLTNICDGTILPPNSRVSENMDLPYVFLGDGSLELKTRLMTPIPGRHASDTPERLYNQTLARSRAVADNTFGILSSVFKVFKKPIPLDIAKTSMVTRTCLLLHNFLRKSDLSRDIYNPPGYVDSYQKGELTSLGKRVDYNSENLFSMQPLPCGVNVDAEALQIRTNFITHIQCD